MKAYDQIYEVASENYGLVTTEMARKLGVSGMDLVMLEKRGRVSRVGRGVYRLEQFPASEYDSYAAVVAKAGKGAFLWGPSVLAMENLCPTDPSKLYVGVPGRVRRNLGRGVVVWQNAVTENAAGLRGIPAQSIGEAIRDSRDMIMTDRLLDAVRHAYERGMMTRDESEQLRKELVHGN